MPHITFERCGTRPSCRVCDGPAAPAGMISLSSDAAPCRRARWAHLQRCPQPVRRARSARWRNISFERCGAMLSRHASEGPAAAGELRCRAVAPEAGLWRVGTCLPALCRRCPGGVPAEPCRFAGAGSGYGRSLLLRDSRRVYRRFVLPLERARRNRSTCRSLALSRAWRRRTLLRVGFCVRAAACVCGRCQWRRQYRASSTSRHDLSFERCGAMPSCPRCSPTVLPSACATGPQHPHS